MQNRLHFSNIFPVILKKKVINQEGNNKNKDFLKRKWILATIMLGLICMPWGKSAVECKVSDSNKIPTKNGLNSNSTSTTTSSSTNKANSNVADLVANDIRFVFSRLGLGLKNNGTHFLPNKASKNVETVQLKGNSSLEKSNSTGEGNITSVVGQVETTLSIGKSDLEITSSTEKVQATKDDLFPEKAKELLKDIEDPVDVVHSLEVVDDAIEVVEVEENSAKEQGTEANSIEIEDRRDIIDELDPYSSYEIENELYEKEEAVEEEEEEEDIEEDFSPSTTIKYRTRARRPKPNRNLYPTTSIPSAAIDIEEDDTDYAFQTTPPKMFQKPRHKVTYLKRVPSRLVALSSTTALTTSATTRRPNLIRIKHKSKPTPAPIMKTTHYDELEYELERDPHHPHGIIVHDQRTKRPIRRPTKRPVKLKQTQPPKPRPRPSRRTTTARTTTTVSTTTTTTSTTKAPSTSSSTRVDPEEFDYYDYFLSAAGENDIGGSNNSNSTGNKTQITRIPLSKLALAMLASSAGFENGTDEEEMLYYPKTPVNLLNILQAYTKQLQVAQEETFKPPLKVQSQPFVLQLNRLNFATKIGISVYYSLIAIIPLVYLAFGGIGRLGLNALVGRNLGRRRRRKKRSLGSDYYHYFYGGGGGKGSGNNYDSNFSREQYQKNTIKRIHLEEQEKEEEYNWILERISEVIWKLSQLSYEMDNTKNYANNDLEDFRFT